MTPIDTRHFRPIGSIATLAMALAVAPPVLAKPADLPVKPLAYRLDLTIMPDQPRFSGHVEIDVDLAHPSRSIALDGEGLHVIDAKVRTSGKTVAAVYRQADADDHAVLETAQPVHRGRATLILDYDAAFGDWPQGLYHASVNRHWYAWTQLEARNARKMFPGFDRPGHKVPFPISVATDPKLVVVSNTVEQSTSTEGPLQRHHFAPTAPLPTYLIAVGVGPFKTASTTIDPNAVRSRPLPLRIVAPQGAPSSKFALTQTGPILSQLETYMGRSYPYAKLDQIASPLMSGAMENAGAIIYDQATLLPADPLSPVSQRSFVRDVSHEVAHQWFGDLVTPKSWNDLWLNESFANWMSYRIGDRWRPELQIGVQMAVEAVEAMRQDELSATHPVHQLAGEDSEPFFDGITYGKGGQVLAMFEAYLGERRFRAGLQLYLRRYANRDADTADFFEALSEAVQNPQVTRALRGFVDQPGIPVIAFERSAMGYQISQKRYARLGDAVPAQRWLVPVCYRIEAARSCVLLGDTAMTIHVPRRRTLMPNAGGSGYYRFSLAPREWHLLIETSASLPPAEALMTIDSLWAAFAAGEIRTDLLIEAGCRMVNNPYGASATATGQRLAELRRQGLISADHRAAYERFVVSLYRPLLDQMGLDASATIRAGDTADRQQLRFELQKLLVEEGRDPDVLAALAQAAERAIAGQSDALAPTLSVTGYAAYIGAAPNTRVGAMFKRMARETERNQREIIAYALGTQRDEVAGNWLLDHLDDGRLSFADRREVLQGLSEETETRPAALRWIVSHLDLLSRRSLPELIVSYGGNACSAADAQMWDAAIRPRVAGDVAATLALDVAIEKLGNCERLRALRGDDLADAFRTAD